MKKWIKPEIKVIPMKKITLSGSSTDGEDGNNAAKKKLASVF